jgi:LysM repeat protein
VKRLPFSPKWFIVSLVAILALTACERPIPGSDAVESPDNVQPTSFPIEIPTALPTSAAPDAEATTAPESVDTSQPAETGGTDTEAEAADTTTETPAEPAAGSEAPAEPATTEVIHTVQSGDTLSQLAEFYNVSVEDIAAANGITNIDTLSAGQQLIIPAAGTAASTTTTTPSTGDGELTHTVRAGENLFRIGLAYGFTIEELASYNGISDPARIEVGQVIRIPPGGE